MKQKLPLLFFLAIVIALPLFITTTQRSTRYKQQAAENTTPYFAINPAEGQKPMDTTFEVQLNLANPADVIAADITILFDSSIIELINFKPTATQLSTILQKTDNQKGIIRYAGANTSSNPTTGDIATLTFKAKQKGTTDISFIDSKIILRGGSQAFIPGNNIKGTYTIQALRNPYIKPNMKRLELNK